MNVEDVLTLLLREPGRPRLTWYGPDDERIELSGAVLVNWVTKVSNLLMTEHDAGPGFRVLLDLPGHWRTVVWALGVWRVGGCVVLPGAPGPVDLVVSSSGLAWPGVPTYAVSLPGLALRWPGVLPAGVMDAGPAVMGQPDVLVMAAGVAAHAWALAGPHGPETRHADLVPRQPPAIGRVLRSLAETADQDAGPTLTDVLAALACGGSAVLVAAETARSLRADPGRWQSLLVTERIDESRDPST